MMDLEEDILEDDYSENEYYLTSTRWFLHNYFKNKNYWDLDEKDFKRALLNILRDWYWVRNKNDYRALKKLLDENPIWILLPEDINITSDWTKIFVYRDNKILVTNETKDEVWTIDKTWFNEPYYNYWQKVSIDLDTVFYT